MEKRTIIVIVMNYKITVNTLPKSSFDVAAWNLIDKDEPERICIKKDHKEYAFVFEKDRILLETWFLDNKGELQDLEDVLVLEQNNHPHTKIFK